MYDNILLKNYICETPFIYVAVDHKDTQFLCCPSWLPLNIKSDKEKNDNLIINWTSNNAFKIRKSVYDGTYSECDNKLCPKLNKLINLKEIPTGFLSKSYFEKKYNIKSIEDIENFKNPPEEILFGFDRSCNLKCPSCRLELISNDRIDSKQYKDKLELLKSIEENFGSNLKKISITGSGDPLYSKIYRDYLQNFDITKYPKLERIQLITNGNLLTEKMWNSMKASTYIKDIEISVDAGTKDTYENVTRLGGNWDILMNNLKFISTVKTLDEIVFSMVVSKNNYKEMYELYKVIENIFNIDNNNVNVHYRQIDNWGTYSKEEMIDLQIFKNTHKLYKDFQIELEKVNDKPGVYHSFNHTLLRRLL